MPKTPNPETCERCPHRYSKTGCPCWIKPAAGFLETNVQTGEERFIVGCFYQVVPKLLTHVIAAANRPAAAVETMRNEMVQGLRVIASRPFPKPPMAQAIECDYHEVEDGSE